MWRKAGMDWLLQNNYAVGWRHSYETALWLAVVGEVRRPFPVIEQIQQLSPTTTIKHLHHYLHTTPCNSSVITTVNRIILYSADQYLFHMGDEVSWFNTKSTLDGKTSNIFQEMKKQQNRKIKQTRKEPSAIVHSIQYITECARYWKSPTERTTKILSVVYGMVVCYLPHVGECKTKRVSIKTADGICVGEPWDTQHTFHLQYS